MNEIIYMQKYLSLIRMIAGWTAKEMGEKLGVTRQMISTLELKKNEKYHMTKMQYLAISYILDEEIRNHPEDTYMLKAFLEMMVYNHEMYKEEECNKLLNITNLIAPSILAKACTRKEVSDKFQELFAN